MQKTLLILKPGIHEKNIFKEIINLIYNFKNENNFKIESSIITRLKPSEVNELYYKHINKEG